jgi:hypothetical protein
VASNVFYMYFVIILKVVRTNHVLYIYKYISYFMGISSVYSPVILYHIFILLTFPKNKERVYYNIYIIIYKVSHVRGTSDILLDLYM